MIKIRKKRIIIPFFSLLLMAILTLCAFTLTACDEDEPIHTGNSQISFTTLTVDGKNVYGKVANSVNTFSFANEIQLSGKSDFVVSLDEDGLQTYTTKSTPLVEGDNTFYILETINSIHKHTYIVTIHRNYMYTVDFDTVGGTKVPKQKIEEDICVHATEPDSPTREGYTFDGWDYDFNIPITKNTTIKAKWKINQYTLRLVYNNGQEDLVLTQDYDTTIQGIANPQRVGYTFDGWDNIIPSKMPAEDLTITANWLAIFNVSNGKIMGITEHGETLEEIVIPNIIDGVEITSISGTAFYGCTSLKSIIVENGNANYKSIDGNLYSKDGKTLIKYAMGKAERVFVIPKSVISIGEDAFEYCTSLTSIVIPESVASIGRASLNNCSSLTSIVIPESITSIGIDAFSFCTSLSKVNYLGTIDQWAQISFANEVANPTYYAKNLYIKDELVKEVVLTSATKISACAFTNCNSLTSVVIPTNVKSIGDLAFSNCNSLTSVEILDGVTSIGEVAFSCCSSLKNLIIGNSVASIGGLAFFMCKSLTSVTIGNSVTSIGGGSFFDCSSLTSIEFKGTVQQWESIEKDNDWNTYVPATKVICSDGEVDI
ncbi:MAG: leucine-rich repeat protein [Clostridia bacterium]|nr:leucine-rich repeat protein [Clostridia bacterium]